MSAVKRGLKDRYIVIDKKGKSVTYLPQGKARNLKNPEEQVQLDTYLSLIYDYGYPPEHLRVCEKIKIGSSSREVDVMVFKDDDAKDPWIVVECKKRGVGNSVFEEAIDQGFSYAAATNAEYVWATSGDKDAMFEVDHQKINERNTNRIPDIPHYKKGYKKGEGGFFRWLYRNPILSDAVLYGVILFIATAILAKVAVEAIENNSAWIKKVLDQPRIDYNDLYNGIVMGASFITLIFGGMFMRSHQFFRVSSGRKYFNYVVIALLLFIPAWYVGKSDHNPIWWSDSTLPWWSDTNYFKYDQKGYPIAIFLWPYLKSWFWQVLAITGLIWLMTRRR